LRKEVFSAFTKKKYFWNCKQLILGVFFIKKLLRIYDSVIQKIRMLGFPLFFMNKKYWKTLALPLGGVLGLFLDNFFILRSCYGAVFLRKIVGFVLGSLINSPRLQPLLLLEEKKEKISFFFFLP